MIHFSLRQDVVPIITAPESIRLMEADDPAFRALWREFLGFLSMHGFRYEPAVREFYQMLSAPGVVDLSFVVRNDRFPVAICPLMVERIGGRVQGSHGGGGFLPAPLFHPQLGRRQLRALEAMVFKEAVARLDKAGARRWLVEAETLSVGTDVLEDLLPARFGALDVSRQCHIMDLTRPDQDLWSQLRHSAKSTINQGLKLYEFKVYDATNYSQEVGDRHRLLHHKCSGRVTRPVETFYKMYSWIAEGCGLMFEQLHRGVTVQMIFVALGKHTAAGASAADDPDFDAKVPLTHSMNYFIYQETRRRSAHYYDVGDTTYRDSLFCLRTPKERSICDFKRGFGDFSLPYKRWIWFADPAEELAFLDEQLASYKAHVSTHAVRSADQLRALPAES